MLCYNLYYDYHIKKNLPIDFVTFSVTDMLAFKMIILTSKVIKL